MATSATYTPSLSLAPAGDAASAPTDSAKPVTGLPVSVSSVKVVESQIKDGSHVFVLSVEQAEVKSIQVLDLDMLIVLNNGEGLLLREGAFLATTNAAQKVSFGSAESFLVSDLLKQVGEMKPSESASFRLSSTDIKSGKSDAPGGQGLNLGKGDDDAQTGPAHEEITQIIQSLQNARLSDNPLRENSQPVKPLRLLDNVADPVVLQPAASPGDTKKLDEIKKEDNTNTGQVETVVDVTWKPHDSFKITNIALVDGNLTLSTLKFDNVLSSSPLMVKMTAGSTSTAVNPAWGADANATLVKGTLKLTQLSSATQLRLSIAKDTDIPAGLTINGQAVTGAEQTLLIDLTPGVSTTDLAVTWDVAANPVAPTGAFQILAKYLNAGVELEKGGRTMTLQYGNVTESSQLYQGDANGNLVLQLPSNGLSYDIEGTSGNDAILAWNGDDILRGMGGNDTLDGGRGKDTVSFEHMVSTGAVVSLASPPAGTVFISIENLTGSSGADHLTGDEQANVIKGLDGDDTLVGGGGKDTLDGGLGKDYVSYQDQDSTTGVVVSLAGQPAENGDVTFVNVEGLIGSKWADQLTGAATDSALDGRAGDDLLQGGTGIDTLRGGDGNDTLMGGAGGDSLIGGNGVADVNGDDDVNGTADVVSYANFLGTVSREGLVIDLQNTANSTGDAKDDTYSGLEVLEGSGKDDTVLGGHASIRTLHGGGGDDVFKRIDLVKDTILGGAGIDSIDLTAQPNAQNSIRFELTSSQFASIEVVVGTTGNDTLDGRAYNGPLTLMGGEGAGNDILKGGLSDDTLIGGAGDDTLMGGGGTDVLRGGDGSDWADFSDRSAGLANLAIGVYDSIENVIGTAYDDTLVAKAGDEANAYWGGAEGFGGADGTDSLSYENAASAVKASLATGGTLGDAAGDTYQSIENLTGSSYADELQGDDANNWLQGKAGDDRLLHSKGHDTLDGGAGVDTVDYTGVSRAVSANLLTKVGTVGDGSQQELRSIENITGGGSDDLIVGSDSANTLLGMDGQDLLAGGAGDDNLQGGAGADTLDGGAGADILSGGRGIDTVTYAASTATVTVDLTLTDRGAADALNDGVGDALIGIESIIGSAGNDLFYASVDAVTISGGVGIDTVDYSKHTALLDTDAGVTVDLQRTPQSLNFVAGTGWAANDVFESIENLVGTQGRDALYGDAGNNNMSGGGGDDTLQGRSGNDTLDGGAGVNTLSYKDRTAGIDVTVDLSSSPDVNGFTEVRVGSEIDKVTNFANVVGGAGNDSLTGNAFDNKLEGAEGADALVGLIGADSLFGGLGDDTLAGGEGADVLDGGEGQDLASYATAVTVDLSGRLTAMGEAMGDTFNSIEGLIGSAFNDVLGAADAGSTLQAGAGDDVLYSGRGADSLVGGDGVDVVSYDAVVHDNGVIVDLLNTSLSKGDVLVGIESVFGSKGSDTFYAIASASIYIDGGNDTTSDTFKNTVSYEKSGLAVNAATGVTASLADNSKFSANIDHLIGSAARDLLTGNELANSIMGGAGNDTLQVSAGNDTLDGGTGIDFVDFSSLGASIAFTLPGDGGEITRSVNVGGSTHQLTLKNIEGLKATNFDDSVTGSASDDEIHGLEGNDALTGAGGDDTLLGGVRADTLDGGDGFDFSSYAEATTGLVIDLVGSTDTDEADGDVFSNIEGVIGSSGNDTIIGGHASIRILKGEAGNDTFKAIDLSTDTISGGEGSDTIDMAGSIGTAITLTSAKYSSVEVVTGTASNETMDASAWAAAITLDGGGGNDTLTGGSASDVLRGGTGDDSLTGGLGDDKLYAGTGQKDTLSGGQGADELFGRDSTGQFSGGDGNDVIHADHSAMASSTVEGGTGTDKLVLYMSSSAGLVMDAAFFPNANFQNIEILDLSKDDYASDLTLTKEGIAHLVDTNVAGVDLTIQLEAGKDKLGGLTFTAGSATTWTDTATDWSAKVEWV